MTADGLAMPIVFSDRHRMHDPGGEVWVGGAPDGTELPARAERIREALAAVGAPGSSRPKSPTRRLCMRSTIRRWSPIWSGRGRSGRRPG